MPGPYDTEAQALADLATAVTSDPPAAGAQHEPLRAYLTAALVESGVELGEFDARIVDWLTGWEPATVQVIAGWTMRSNASGGGDR
jgi:hypothetical protein